MKLNKSKEKKSSEKFWVIISVPVMEDLVMGEIAEVYPQETKLDKIIEELDAMAEKYPTSKFYLLQAMGEAKGRTRVEINRFMY